MAIPNRVSMCALCDESTNALTRPLRNCANRTSARLLCKGTEVYDARPRLRVTSRTPQTLSQLFVAS